MNNTLYIVKEMENRNTTLYEIVDYKPILRHNNTLRYGLFWGGKEYALGKHALDYKLGHIEVSVIENNNVHFAERLPKFLDEVAKLYDKIVLGNTEIDCEIEHI